MTKDKEPVATMTQGRSEQSAPDTTETERTINALLREDDLVYEDYMRRIGAHIPRRRSKRGQRRAAAKRWWIRD